MIHGMECIKNHDFIVCDKWRRDLFLFRYSTE